MLSIGDIVSGQIQWVDIPYDKCKIREKQSNTILECVVKWNKNFSLNENIKSFFKEGKMITAWILFIDNSSSKAFITFSPFGTKKPKEESINSYLDSLMNFRAFVENRTNEQQDLTKIKGYISVIKGLFNRCIRRDQNDWLFIYKAFNFINESEINQCINTLSNIKQKLDIFLNSHPRNDVYHINNLLGDIKNINELTYKLHTAIIFMQDEYSYNEKIYIDISKKVEYLYDKVGVDLEETKIQQGSKEISKEVSEIRQIDLLNGVRNYKSIGHGNVNPQKTIASVSRTERNQNIVKYLKELYEDRCQICGERLCVGKDSFYSEVHHIQPIGAHNGADIIENMIVLCPNHHVLFDRGVITIDLKNKLVKHYNVTDPLNNKSIIIKHNLDVKYIEYYNKKIYLSNKIKIVTSQFSNGKCKVMKEDHEVIPFIERVDGYVFYEDVVVLRDVENNNLYYTLDRLPSQENRALMKPIENKVFNKKIGDLVKYNGHTYKIYKIL
jgi:hypothetical protein